MAINKNALIRYKTIDKCLQNHYKKWTLNDLIEACSDALYEYENKAVSVSKRTIQLDIQTLRSNKLGYNAPIEVYDRKYYRYATANYSITAIPLTQNDMNILSETVEMLKQFKDFSLFKEMNAIIHKFEDKIYTEKNKTNAIIHLDKNQKLKGLEHFDTLYQAIAKKIAIIIQYQSFKSRSATALTFHPFILKEFNNRWFLIGVKDENKKNILTLALDRIKSIQLDLKTTYFESDFDGNEYYLHTIGVTVKPSEFVEKVVFKANRQNAPYIETKPLHHSQETIGRDETGWVVFKMNVVQNFELERLLLGFGENIEILKPSSLRRSIKRKFRKALSLY